VNAFNTHWDRTSLNGTSLGGTNPFHVNVTFATNPGNAYQFQVFTNCSGTGAGCPDGSQPITGTDAWELNASGETACVSGTPGPSHQKCQNHQQQYFIRVTLAGAPSCSSYTLKVTNGL